MLSNLILAAVTYLSPVHFDVLLAGNFGEPRPNHFHGGLDIKTQKVEGKAIYSIGDGYVCRVTKNVGGMGNALYVRHPEGYTSVYAHLQRFAPAIEAVVRKWQYQHQQTDLDLKLEATACPVTRGQLIALSGDTGASMGPHLHLEIHQTDTWNIVDPLEFIPDLLTDSIPPKAHAIMAYPMEGEGMFCGKDEQQRFDFDNSVITDTLTAWGKVGFGIFADDYMQGSENRYGIRYTALYVDGKEVFTSNVDNIPMDCHKMVNVWGDYDYYAANQVWFIRSYVLPANKLPFIKTGPNKGVVNFSEQKPYQLTYVLCDFFGNKAQYSFVVYGQPQDLKHEEPADSIRFIHGRENDAGTEGMSVMVPKGGMMRDTWVKASDKARPSKYSKGYMLAQKSIPLFEKARLRLKVETEVEDKGKLCVVSLRRNKKNELDPEAEARMYIPATYKDGWMECDIDDIGNSYAVDYDDSPPKVLPLNQSNWESEETLLVDVKDDQTGVARFQAFIDGQFVLFDHVKKSTRMVCSLKDTPVEKKGAERRLLLKALDNVGNETIYDTTILY
ncbi:MAG: M23 family metallopeptidase [Prevotella sp.]|nr:M23 family metallopeptidase [Prevotella sp.]